MATVDFLLDGMLSGSGIRDAVNGGYVKPADISLSGGLQAKIGDWLRRYEDVHYRGFEPAAVNALDKEGQEIVSLIQGEQPELRIDYFSSGLMNRIDP